MAVKKLVFPVNSHKLEAYYDKKKKASLIDTIWLEFQPDLNIDYLFAMVWFNLPISHFIFKHKRSNFSQIDSQDIGELFFPKNIQFADNQKLLREIKIAYSILFDEINEFWYAFDEFFYNTRHIGKPIEDNFFHYTWEQFWKVVTEIRKNNGIEEYKPHAEGRKALFVVFRNQKFRLEALHSKITKIETELNHLVYKLYDLTEEEITIIENEK